MSERVATALHSILAEAANRLGVREPDGVPGLARRLGIGGFVARHDRDRGSAQPSRDGMRLLGGLAERVMLDAAGELSAALASRGIPHFFMKGVALVGRVYRAGDRVMGDIDLQVAPAARELAQEELVRLGYALLPDEMQDGPAALRSGAVYGRAEGASVLEQVVVDVRWGLDPVQRLLPRPDLTVPDVVWRALETCGQLTVPADAHHAALIVHHLVHHDMLPFRGVVDLALLWSRLGPESGHDVEAVSAELGVLRVTRLLGELVEDAFGVPNPGLGTAPGDARARRLRRLLEPVSWCIWVVTAPEHEEAAITPRRITRRLLLIDRIAGALGLFGDALVPPSTYLRWRWPESGTVLGAEWRHLRRTLAKLSAG